MGQIIKSDKSVCLSVCLSTHVPSKFLFDFDENLHNHIGLKTKKEFVRGSKSDDPFPILPIFSPRDAFSISVTRSVVKNSNDVLGERLHAQSCKMM